MVFISSVLFISYLMKKIDAVEVFKLIIRGLLMLALSSIKVVGPDHLPRSTQMKAVHASP